MAETTPNPIEALVTEARQRIAEAMSAKAGQLDELEKSLLDFQGQWKKPLEEMERQLNELRDSQHKLQEEIERQLDLLAGHRMQELRDRQKKLEETVQKQLDQLAAYQPPPAPAPAAPLDKVLNSVRNLITATLPEQVMEVLTEEAAQIGVRAAVFDVRGKSAWGSSAHGFGSDLSAKILRGLVVPLNQENPFRQTFETGDAVTTTADHLKKNRNILDKLKPGKQDEILLLPVRSAGSVSAILYSDSGGKEPPLPVDALKILSEFAGAQLDRLMALSGGPAETEEKEVHEPEREPEHEEQQEAATAPEPEKQEPWEEAVNKAAGVQAAEATAVEEAPAPPPAPEPVAEAPPPPAPAPAADVSQLSEEDQKYHKDAKRFAKLLVSEIELYNKTKVADGRKNGDLYKRLKSDIERSRLTFQKRFAKTVGKQFDYFHEEIIRTLANNDASLMGPEYPGSSA